jgi:hypothetical protein
MVLPFDVSCETVPDAAVMAVIGGTVATDNTLLSAEPSPTKFPVAVMLLTEIFDGSRALLSVPLLMLLALPSNPEIPVKRDPLPSM